MSRQLSFVAVVLCGLVAPAAAQDAGQKPEEIAQAVGALASADSKARDDAVARLAHEGPGAVEAIVAAAAAHPAAAAVWKGLGEALSRWEGSSAADALSQARVSWPAPVRSRLDLLVHELRVGKPLGPFPDCGESPAEVRAKVAEILARYDGPPHYRIPNPDAAEMAKLGRDAIPALVAELRADSSSAPRSMHFRAWAAADALDLLAEERDVPLIRDLLQMGCSTAARSLRRVRSPAAMDALVAAIEAGSVESDLTESLEAQGAGPRADLALIGWIERNAVNGSLSPAAEYLAGRRCDAAIPALELALEASGDEYSRVGVAEALTKLGDRTGIEALLDLFEARVQPWTKQSTGEALNEVVGRSVFKPTAHTPGTLPGGNFEEAAAEFRAWWAANADKVVFDREACRWRVGDAVAMPESPPEIAAKVRALLAPTDHQRDWSAFNETGRNLVALGHDAVPELMRQLADEKRGRGMRYARINAVTEALAALLRESDIPALARLLADGQSFAADALKRIHSDAARDALLGAFAKGVGGYEVARALGPYAADPVTRAAVVEWLRKFGSGDFSVGEVAKLAEAAGGDDALAALRGVAKAGVDDHARANVSAAIARLGGREGIEDLVLLAESDAPGATDAANALNGICGRHVFETRTTGPVGRSGNIDEASAFFRKWWDESKDRLRFDPSRRRWTTGDAGSSIDIGKSPPEVEAKVAQILATASGRNGYVFGGRDSKDLAALGREAVPALLARIRESTAWDDDPGADCWAAGEALRELRTDADVAVLTALLREGHLAAATSLSGCRDPRARDALLAVLARGFDEMSLMNALATMPVDAATWDAVRAAIGAMKSRSGAWLGRYIERHVTAEAAPVLRECLARPGIDPLFAVRCASGLVRIGDAAGIETLLRVLDGPPSDSGWSSDPRAIAASRLNSVAGRRVFVEAEEGLPGTGYEDAAKTFRAWWAANSKSLRFDAVRRTWTSEAPAQAGAAEVAPALREKVATILADARGASSFSSGPSDEFMDPHARQLVELGRDVLPLLVAAVRDGWPWQGDRFVDNGVCSAEQALVRAAAAEDRATMIELLGEGRIRIARWFAKHPSPEGRDVLLGVVRRGFLDSDLLGALERHAAQTNVHEVLADWAVRYGASASDVAQPLAEILGTPPDGTFAPRLPDLLDRAIPDHTRWRIASELAKHGVKDGVAALAAMFTDGEGLTGDDVAYVALALNEIAGTKLVEVEGGGHPSDDFGPDRPPPRVIWSKERPGVVKDRAGAAARVRRWWDENGERLRFDVAGRRWTTAK
jgi:hypothetical protein